MTFHEISSTALAPIAIFAFNRPDALTKLLKSLQACPEFKASTVHIFIDGPRHATEARAVDKVRKVAEALQHDHLTIRSKEANVGLQASIIAGVTHLCEIYGSAIVLEDDLEVSPDLLAYFNAALTRYKSNEAVWSVCADVPVLRPPAATEAKFLPVGSSWGWATWARAWRRFNKDIRVPDKVKRTRAFRDRFSGHGLRDFPGALGRADAGQVDSWFVYWQLAIVRHNGLSVYPPAPMVRNHGQSGGTHGSSLNLMRLSDFTEKPLGRFDFWLPEEPTLDFLFLDQIIHSSEWRLLRMNTVLGRTKRTWRKLLRL